MPGFGFAISSSIGGGKAGAPFETSEAALLLTLSDTSTVFVNTDGTGGTPASGGVAGRVNDTSGNARHMSATSDAARPIYSLQNRITFNGSDQSMETGTISIQAPTVAGMVISFVGQSSSNSGPSVHCTVDGNECILFAQGPIYRFLVAGNTLNFGSRQTKSINTLVISPDGSLQAYQDGALGATNTVATTAIDGAMTNVRLGWNGATSYGEPVMYALAIVPDASRRPAVESYMRQF